MANNGNRSSGNSERGLGSPKVPESKRREIASMGGKARGEQRREESER